MCDDLMVSDHGLAAQVFSSLKETRRPETDHPVETDRKLASVFDVIVTIESQIKRAWVA